MRAVVCEAFGPVENLQLKEIAAPEAGKHEVVIDIAAAGVNFPDSMLVQGTYQIQPELPFTPGTEVAGTIRALGEQVKHLKVGQRVLAFCMLGGFAEQVAVNAMAVMPLPDEIPAEEAAGLLTAHATAHHALRQRGELQAGETLLVTGAAGGTGLAAVQIGKAIGAKVIAVFVLEVASNSISGCGILLLPRKELTFPYTTYSAPITKLLSKKCAPLNQINSITPVSSLNLPTNRFCRPSPIIVNRRKTPFN